MGEVFTERRERLQENHCVVLIHPGYFGKSTKRVKNIQSHSRNESKQWRKIFDILVALTICTGKKCSSERFW